MAASLLLALASGGCAGSEEGPPDAGHPVDQCLGDADMPLVLDLQADAGLQDGGYTTEMASILERCARDVCLSELIAESGLESCMDGCLVESAAGALTSGCRSCFILTVACARAHCAVACLGADPVACEECGATYCTETVDSCLGFTVP